MELVVLAQQRPEHRLAISPTVVAFAELLCLALPEVTRAVERELSDNPALEHIPRLARDVVSLDRAVSIVDQPTDAARLLAEVRLALPEQEHALAELVVGSLDERGFVTASVGELARWSASILGELKLCSPRCAPMGRPVSARAACASACCCSWKGWTALIRSLAR